MGDGRPAARRWLALAGPVVALLVVAFDWLSVPVLAPAVGAGLALVGGPLGWVLATPMMTLAAALPGVVRLGARLGPAAGLRLGAALVVAGTAGAAAASSATQLAAARAGLGLGAAVVVGVTPRLVAAAFPAADRSLAVGVWVGFAALGVLIGPLVSGWLLGVAWWGSVFVVEATLALIGLAAALALVPGCLQPSAAGGPKRAGSAPGLSAPAAAGAVSFVLFGADYVAGSAVHAAGGSPLTVAVPVVVAALALAVAGRSCAGLGAGRLGAPVAALGSVVAAGPLVGWVVGGVPGSLALASLSLVVVGAGSGTTFAALPATSYLAGGVARALGSGLGVAVCSQLGGGTAAVGLLAVTVTGGLAALNAGRQRGRVGAQRSDGDASGVREVAACDR